MPVFCEYCVLPSRGLCDKLITRLEEFYRLRCVVVCDLETSLMWRSCPPGGCYAEKYVYLFIIYLFMLFIKHYI